MWKFILPVGGWKKSLDQCECERELWTDNAARMWSSSTRLGAQAYIYISPKGIENGILNL